MEVCKVRVEEECVKEQHLYVIKSNVYVPGNGCVHAEMHKHGHGHGRTKICCMALIA